MRRPGAACAAGTALRGLQNRVAPGRDSWPMGLPAPLDLVDRWPGGLASRVIPGELNGSSTHEPHHRALDPASGGPGSRSRAPGADRAGAGGELRGRLLLPGRRRECPAVVVGDAPGEREGQSRPGRGSHSTDPGSRGPRRGPVVDDHALREPRGGHRSVRRTVVPHLDRGSAGPAAVRLRRGGHAARRRRLTADGGPYRAGPTAPTAAA